MKAEFTKGNWKSVDKYDVTNTDDGIFTAVLCEEEDTFICEEVWGAHVTEAEANANLISAAPDMFNVLVLLLPKIEVLGGLKKEVEMIKAALAKTQFNS